MTDGKHYAWAVRTPRSVDGTHWHLFTARRDARAFRRQYRGRLYHIIEAH